MAPPARTWMALALLAVLASAGAATLPPLPLSGKPEPGHHHPLAPLSGGAKGLPLAAAFEAHTKPGHAALTRANPSAPPKPDLGAIKHALLAKLAATGRLAAKPRAPALPLPLAGARARAASAAAAAELRVAGEMLDAAAPHQRRGLKGSKGHAQHVDLPLGTNPSAPPTLPEQPKHAKHAQKHAQHVDLPLGTNPSAPPTLPEQPKHAKHAQKHAQHVDLPLGANPSAPPTLPEQPKHAKHAQKHAKLEAPLANPSAPPTLLEHAKHAKLGKSAARGQQHSPAAAPAQRPRAAPHRSGAPRPSCACSPRPRAVMARSPRPLRLLCITAAALALLAPRRASAGGGALVDALVPDALASQLSAALSSGELPVSQLDLPVWRPPAGAWPMPTPHKDVLNFNTSVRVGKAAKGGVMVLDIHFKPLAGVNSSHVVWLFNNLHVRGGARQGARGTTGRGGARTPPRRCQSVTDTASRRLRRARAPQHNVTYVDPAAGTRRPVPMYLLFHPIDHLFHTASPPGVVKAGTKFIWCELPLTGCTYQPASATEPWVCPAARRGFVRADPPSAWGPVMHTKVEQEVVAFNASTMQFVAKHYNPAFGGDGVRTVTTVTHSWADSPQGLRLRTQMWMGLMARGSHSAFDTSLVGVAANHVIAASYVGGASNVPPGNVTAAAYMAVHHYVQAREARPPARTLRLPAAQRETALAGAADRQTARRRRRSRARAGVWRHALLAAGGVQQPAPRHVSPAGGRQRGAQE
ncbi:hypothetical protein HT031_003769 [Scenedesmus sp. PABB004]|nr:hypothetical protein HT031_003769 [Scenedesmus sp. PABB004]